MAYFKFCNYLNNNWPDVHHDLPVVHYQEQHAVIQQHIERTLKNKTVRGYMRRIHDVRRGFEYLSPNAAADCVITGGYALERTPFLGEGAVRR